MIKRMGKRTLSFENGVSIEGFASVVGKKEGEGPLANFFDRIIEDSYNSRDTFEDAEASFVSEAAALAMKKSGRKREELDFAFAGDLLNQCVSSSFGLKEYNIPYLCQYGACSTMAQALIAGAVFVESGAARNALACASSHFASAQRQYRFPMEYGEVRTPTSQWTVTGAGACVLGTAKSKPKLTAATVGKIVDLGIKDANNMGAAMAPAVDIIEPYPIGFDGCYINNLTAVTSIIYMKGVFPIG